MIISLSNSWCSIQSGRNESDNCCDREDIVEVRKRVQICRSGGPRGTGVRLFSAVGALRGCGQVLQCPGESSGVGHVSGGWSEAYGCPAVLGSAGRVRRRVVRGERVSGSSQRCGPCETAGRSDECGGGGGK